MTTEHSTAPTDQGVYECGCPWGPWRWVHDAAGHAEYHRLAPVPIGPPKWRAPVNANYSNAERARNRAALTRAEIGREAVKMRSDARPTSRAAGALALPKSGTQRGRVLAYVGFASRHPVLLGATDAEIAAHLTLSLNSVRPRRLELVESGLVVDTGVVRADHGVWRISPAAVARFGAGSGPCRCGVCAT